MHPNEDGGNGLSQHFLGEQSGSETVTLLDSEMPAHSHAVMAVAGGFGGNTGVPDGNSFAKSGQGNAYTTAANLVQMSDEALSVAGADFPHNNMQPYLTLSFCIALQGVFPPRP